MSEAKKPAAMVEINPGSPEWQAWLAHHRGTKTEMRMLLCLGGKTKSGDVIPPRPWLAVSRLPPSPPSPAGVTRTCPQTAASLLPLVHASAPEGRIDQIVERMEVAEIRNAKENETEKRRRKKAKHSDDTLEQALEAAKINRTPYINGVENLGTLRVPDPLEEQEIIRAGRGHFTIKKKNAPLRERVVSLRDDPVGRMAKRGQLGPPDERDVGLKAARHWQQFCEQSEIGFASGIDTTRDVVDCSHVPKIDTDQRLMAVEQLKRLSRALGQEGDNLVRRVLAEKLELKQIAVMMGMIGISKKMDEKVLDRLAWRFRECLATIAKHLGYVVETPGRRSPRDRHAAISRFVGNTELDRAARRAINED